MCSQLGSVSHATVAASSFGPPGTAQYWLGLPFGHVDVNGPQPGQAISTGPWGIAVVSQQAQFSANTAGWAPLPQLREGGITVDEGIYHLHPHEAVIPLDKAGGALGGDVHITVNVNGPITRGTKDLAREMAHDIHNELLVIQRQNGTLGFKNS